MPKYEVYWERSGYVEIEADSEKEARSAFLEDHESYESESDTEFTIFSVTELGGE